MKLEDIVKTRNIKAVKENEFSDDEYVTMFRYAVQYNAFAIVEYILEKHYKSNLMIKKMIDNERYMITEPKDILSFEHARFLVTKCLLSKYGIPVDIN